MTDATLEAERVALLDLTPELRAFVAAECGVRPEMLTLSVELLRDRGTDGADAAEFMKHYAERFGVDLSAFEFEQHLGPEAGGIRFCGSNWLLRRSRRPRMTPITLGDLEGARRPAKWTTPNRSPRVLW